MYLRDCFDHLIDSLHAIRLADDVAELTSRTLSLDERIVLDLQRLLLFDDRNLLQRARHFLFQKFVVEWLMNKVERAEQKRFVSSLLVGECRHHDDFDVGMKFARGAQQFDAPHVGHLHVRDNYVSGLLT